MLLRRFDLNWRRAAAELFIVFAGVLIALAADSGRQSFVDRRVARDYQARLLKDFALTIGNGARSDSLFRAVRTHAQAVVPFIRDPSLPLQDTAGFIASLYSTTRKTLHGTQRRVFDELRSTGNLRLLSAEDREHLSDYYSYVEIMDDSWQHDLSQQRDRIRRLMPPDMQAIVRRRCPVSPAKPLTCDAEVNQKEAARVIANVRGNDEVLGDLYLLMQQIDLWLNSLEMTARRTRRVADALD